MLNTSVAALFAAGLAGQTYPDQLDILRGSDVTPQIELVLDTSGSMVTERFVTNCSFFGSTVPGSFNGVGWQLDRLQLLQAALTGCQTPNDGILDEWSSRVLFAVRAFDSSNIDNLVEDFDPAGSNLARLEAAVTGLVAGDATPIAQAYGLAATHMASFFNDTNSSRCRQNYIVLMTDGDGNWSYRSGGGFEAPFTLDYVVGRPPVAFVDTWGEFASGGGGEPEIVPPYADEAAAYLAAGDSLPGVTGNQPIRTHTVAFFAPPDSALLLASMASRGDGLFLDARDFSGLYSAFQQIILSVVARSQANFSPASVQNDGLFAGNYAYNTSFRPVENGPWFGNLKKHCIVPSAPGDTTCLFTRAADGSLLNNPRPTDIWTGTNSQVTSAGGSGDRIWQVQMGIDAETDAVPNNPYTRRTILTWRPGIAGYVRLGVDAWLTSDSWSSTLCEHWSTINKLFGFTFDVRDCAARDYRPAGFDTWPLGDMINGGSALLKYTPTCEAAGSRCFVATVANDGMLHFFNAATGVETSAVVPGDLWAPSLVSDNQLRELMDQPTLESLRRFYFDGKVRLYHRDADNDGVIDAQETAYLIAGLGRGGRSYVRWDVTAFNGVPNANDNPPMPLSVDESTAFRDLRSTWAAPWLGRIRHTDGSVRNAAVFPTGHQRELDAPDAPFAQLIPGLPPPPDTTGGTTQNLGCPAFGLPALLCNPPAPLNGVPCTPCNDVTGLSCPPVPSFDRYCYDWPGWAAFGPPLDQGGPGIGHNLLFGPYSWSTDSREAIAYQVVFERFDLQPGDYIAVLDSRQREVGRLTGSPPGDLALPWVYDRSFFLRFVTDGIDDVSVRGFGIQRVEFLRQARDEDDDGDGDATLTRPQILITDVDRWNGAANQATRAFARPPAAGDLRQASALLARITSDCDGLTQTEVCIDRNGTGGQPAQPDLAYMVCPVSAEPSVYTEGGILRAVYWGDECGQLWKAAVANDGRWSVRRLLRLNNGNGSGATIPGRRSRDYRKIFTKVELVPSTCNGTRALGVYFGTGNAQRPATLDNLTNLDVTNTPGQLSGDADLIGVVWDGPTLPQGATIPTLFNATAVTQIADTRAAAAVNGFYIELAPAEKVLRDPLVFDGVAYFKTYRPTTVATECESARGVERVLAFDNCNARPLQDSNRDGTVNANDRQVWTGETDIGGNLMVLTPARGESFVAVGNTGVEERAALPSRPGRRNLKLFLWRTELSPIF
jgi:hypothetical protein